MYLRPRQVFSRFVVEESVACVDEGGRVVKSFQYAGELFGAVTSVNPHEAEKFHGLKHDVTHKIVARWGRVDLKSGDKLIRGDEIYLVNAVEDVVGQFTIVYVTRRGDLR